MPAAPSSDAALAMFPPIIVLMLIFNGVNIAEENTPALLQFIPQVSFIRWCSEGLAVNEFSGLTFSCEGARGPCAAATTGPGPRAAATTAAPWSAARARAAGRTTFSPVTMPRVPPRKRWSIATTSTATPQMVPVAAMAASRNPVAAIASASRSV